jgi:glycosyltransferase involved in cell wall biosynthesis
MRGRGDTAPVTTSIAPPLHSNGTHLRGARATLRVGIVSTYPPRACGIGTFSQDLRHALLGTGSVSAVDVAAVVREGDARQAAEVVTCIHQDQRREYAAAARALESRGSDVVVIEHEYGIFGGPDGAHVLSLASELRQPMVLTLHTVLSSPHAAQAETLRALCDRATLVCVFTETARRMVVDARLVSPDRVRVVPHGAPPELLPGPSANGRRPLSGNGGAADADGRGPVLATFGLISPGKGIETAIAAMPAIVARHPGARYVVAGRTHPEVAKAHGEEYRISLEGLAHDLRVSDHVVFDDRFLEIEDLASILASTTIFVTPYRSREQIVSGALTFAIVAGCPTVSTPYFYAEDLLGSGAGILVPFDDPAALGEAVGDLLDDPERLAAARAEARAIGRRLTWPDVGRQTAAVLREAVVLGARNPPRRGRAVALPQPRTSHLHSLVDDVGIIQHADGIVPVRSSGYCTDDVARLAIRRPGAAPRDGRRGASANARAKPGLPSARLGRAGARDAQLHVLRPPLAGSAPRRRPPGAHGLGARRGRLVRESPGVADAEPRPAARDAAGRRRAALASDDGLRRPRARPCRPRRGGQPGHRRPRDARRAARRPAARQRIAGLVLGGGLARLRQRQAAPGHDRRGRPARRRRSRARRAALAGLVCARGRHR